MSTLEKPEVAKTVTVPIVEIFGATVQGEGPMAGRVTHFVRVGGCEFRCSWCDSMYAVDPAQWKRAPRMAADDVLHALNDLPGDPEWVTLTGGNPAMYDLGTLVTMLHRSGRKVAVETQGVTWKPWLSMVDCLTISPKAPSSGMDTPKHREQYGRFMMRCVRASRQGIVPDTALKIVVFDEADYEWASERFAEARRGWAKYLSVGTDQGKGDEETIDGILERYTWLADKAKLDPRMRDVCVLPQLHTLLWGTKRGV